MHARLAENPDWNQLSRDMLDMENPGWYYPVTFTSNNCVLNFNARIPAASWEASSLFNIVL